MSTSESTSEMETLRDRFAMVALPVVYDVRDTVVQNAGHAYALADAMLEVRIQARPIRPCAHCGYCTGP